jgi:hypothetical protein
MDEIEILRGAKVRVTTQAVAINGKSTPISEISSAAFIDADHQVRLAPKVLLILGPIVGAAIYLATLNYLAAFLVGVLIMAAGAWVYRQSWLYQVTATTTGKPTPLYRTPKKGDALLLHAAIEKALELRAQQTP